MCEGLAPKYSEETEKGDGGLQVQGMEGRFSLHEKFFGDW